MPITRDQLPSLIEQALTSLGGTAALARVSEWIWAHREGDLRLSGDLFFTWQYDMRWAAQRMKKAGRLAYKRDGGRPVWQLL
jgi:hypothetical protein